MQILYVFFLLLLLMSFTGALKLTRTSRSPLRLHAKRRTKLSKQASNGQQINQTQMSPPETVGDTQIPKANLEQGGEVFGVEVEVLQENSNPNAVKTAPLVIKKGGESFDTQADYDDSWGRVPDTQEPSTMRSIQARLGGEAPTSRLTTKNNARTIGASFQSDLDDFNDRMMAGADSRKQEMSGQEEAGIIKTVKDALSFIMVADFFVVMVFLVWFLAAAAMQKTDPWLLERFQDIFQPVVVPSLTVLMTGSIASGLLGDRKADD